LKAIHIIDFTAQRFSCGIEEIQWLAVIAANDVNDKSMIKEGDALHSKHC
jgi:hypothetical protein